MRIATLGAIASAGGSSSYPAWTAVPGTVFLLDFSEASGNLTDSVSGVVLTAAGSPVYEQTAAAPFDLLSPGIKTINASAGGGNFKNASAQAALDIGTSDFTFEFMAIFHDGQFGQNDANFNARDAITDYGYKFSYDSVSGDGTGAGWMAMVLNADDGTTFLSTSSSVTNPKDGNIHKVRVSGNRAGNMVTYFDGISQRSDDMSGVSGKPILCKRAIVGGNTAGNCINSATYFAMRLVVGSYTANAGGPGGG
ncbi:MAG: hypothetical protein IPI28_18940 [Candidatus Omnitrophica bacterium]|nr:hypothetical protein [Candidatus Omnitrophota bacterium]